MAVRVSGSFRAEEAEVSMMLDMHCNKKIITHDFLFAKERTARLARTLIPMIGADGWILQIWQKVLMPAVRDTRKKNGIHSLIARMFNVASWYLSESHYMPSTRMSTELYGVVSILPNVSLTWFGWGRNDV